MKGEYMDNRDRLINDLALENTKLRIDNMQLNYDIEEMTKKIKELEKIIELKSENKD